ncbi:CYTH and CHAD domain-containing protein [Sulfurimicrobium lacus]|nr:CYTH and CHAD domain-containing protein [Sulfurimicrobium lacus]
MATEIELKLLINPADIARLRRHPLLKAQAAGRARTRNLLSIYFDTPDLTLRQQRVALRVRRVGARWVQTVKGGGEVRAGLHQRGEWEDEVAHERPDLTKIDSPSLLKLFSSAAVRDRLRPIFTTEFKRTTWLLHWDDGDEVELALDQGEVKSGNKTSPVCEIELELKHGNPARLFLAALELQQTIPLRLENVSKADRGYRLSQAAPSLVTKAETLEMTQDMSVTQAFQAIAWNCISHWTANQEGALLSDNPENIHQIRVALRRLRSALPLFRSAIPRESYRAIGEELKWLANALGPARNWDVFVTQTMPPILKQFPADKALQQLFQAARRAQASARNEAHLALRSHRYDRMLLTLGTWLMADGWHAHTSAEQKIRLDAPVAELAKRVLNACHKTLHRHGKSLLAMPTEERHEVRIAVKKLRYATEFFAALFPRKAALAYTEALAALQEELGVLNDAATTDILLQQLKLQDNAAIGAVSGWSAHGVTVHLTSMDAAWKKFYRSSPYWK